MQNERFPNSKLTGKLRAPVQNERFPNSKLTGKLRARVIFLQEKAGKKRKKKVIANRSSCLLLIMLPIAIMPVIADFVVTNSIFQNVGIFLKLKEMSKVSKIEKSYQM